MKRMFNTLFGMLPLLLASILAPSAPGQDAPSAPPVSADDSATFPALPPGIVPNSPFGRVVRMLQAGDAESLVLADINNSTGPFNLTAADLACLNDLGTPGDIENAMIKHDQKPGVTIPANHPSAALSAEMQFPQDVTEDYFYGALAPYGAWIDIPGYGLCWQPSAAVYDPAWAPYCTQGRWVFTDCGWYWLSNYSWGWCVFHYGRWFHDSQRGWCWRPATMWGPSWVFWRLSKNDCGWAPLPPHCYYSQTYGLVYNGATIPAGYDFGFGANLFNFVPTARLCDVNVQRYLLSPAQAGQAFAQSRALVAINSNDRTIVNDGIPVRKIAAFTRGIVPSFTIQPVETVAAPGVRGEQILADGQMLQIHRPYFNTSAGSALREGLIPVPARQQPVPHEPPVIVINENGGSSPAIGNQDNSVIYVDQAAENGPPVPTVTTAGPQDFPANAPAAVTPVADVASGCQSYWSVSAEAPAPVYDASSYASPRLRSHERWQRHVRQPANHQEFAPKPDRSRQWQEQDQTSQSPPPQLWKGNSPTPAADNHPAHSPPSNSPSSPPHAPPAHAAPSAAASGPGHGH